jgi:pilus assembly protein Flp/PilA
MINALLTLISMVEARLGREDGATMVEYGLMVALIAVVVAVAAGALGGRIVGLFDGITF